jgi:hypothetical protein
VRKGLHRGGDCPEAFLETAWAKSPQWSIVEKRGRAYEDGASSDEELLSHSAFVPANPRAPSILPRR